VVNLRGFHSDTDELENTGLVYRRIQFHTWHAEDEDVVEFLRIVTKPENQPVFVHCQHGADRTGTMCAVYRIVVQKWTIEEAIREMTEGGFNYHEIWSNLPKYLRALDVAKLRREAGLDP
jgi:protein tyrosine/serine phosphatase